jgi:hypothetical protein
VKYLDRFLKKHGTRGEGNRQNRRNPPEDSPGAVSTLQNLGDTYPEVLTKPTKPAPHTWDADRAATLMADLNARIDRAQAEPWRTQAERNVLEIVRGLVARYAATNDPVIRDVPRWLDRKLSEWRHRHTVELLGASLWATN